MEMRIVNSHVVADFSSGRKIRLNVGCGRSRKTDYYGVDHVELDSVDIIANLNEPLHLLPADCAEEIHTRNTLQHVREFLGLMAEFHRILQDGGILHAVMPHASNPRASSDPANIRFFTLNTFDAFIDPPHPPHRPVGKIPESHANLRFKPKLIRIRFQRQTFLGSIFGRPFEILVNLTEWNQKFYERRLSRLIPAADIEFKLAAAKQNP